MENWFTWNGVRCTEHGIYVVEQPDVIRPAERLTLTSVPGRAGSLTTTEGENVYDDFVLPVACVVRDLSNLPAITNWLKGAGTLALAARPGGHYKARVANQIAFEQVMRGHEHRTFTVTFRCFPFWYLDGVSNIAITSSGTTVTNPGNIAAEPVMTVTGTGDVSLMVGLSLLSLTGLSGAVTIDTPRMETYSGGVSMNHILSGEYPVLRPGQQAVSWTGSVSRIVITPNWRRL